MVRRAIRIGARIGSLVLVFGAGYLVATVTQPAAEAQIGDLGKQALEKAAGGGGALGTVAELGTTITGLQENVTELQGHIDTLNKIKAALGGG